MAYISPDDARHVVSRVYNSPKWRDRVRDMSDKQVVALYYKFASSGKLDELERRDRVMERPKPIKKKEPRKKITVNEDESYYEQLRFDI